MARVTVIGAGSWGTALAHHLARAGHDVKLWGREPEVLEAIQKHKRNKRYLGDIELDQKLKTATSVEHALAEPEVLVLSVPSDGMRSVAGEVKRIGLPKDPLLVSTAKGLEEKTLYSMTTVLADELGETARLAALSGPSFAKEVALGLPTAVTLAARTEEIADQAAKIFHFEYFRVYTSTDVVGVEFGGVLKNVFALAAGVVDGMGVGSNARAALITRGLAEMQKLVVALGGKPTTVTGLSGLGDLLLTATGDLSRNRRVGVGLGRGEKLEKILKELGQVAEGVKTTPKVLELAKRHQVSMPITEEINHLLAGTRTVEESVKHLLGRTRRSE